MKLKWLDRSAFTLPLFICLATSQKILDAELKRMKLKAELGVTGRADAATHFIDSMDGKKAAIVCLFDFAHLDIKQAYSLLVHEAVHIFQEICKDIGEHTPGIEFEAYSIQKITQDLFYEFDRQTKRKRK